MDFLTEVIERTKSELDKVNYLDEKCEHRPDIVLRFLLDYHGADDLIELLWEEVREREEQWLRKV